MASSDKTIPTNLEKYYGPGCSYPLRLDTQSISAGLNSLLLNFAATEYGPIYKSSQYLSRDYFIDDTSIPPYKLIRIPTTGVWNLSNFTILISTFVVPPVTLKKFELYGFVFHPDILDFMSLVHTKSIIEDFYTENNNSYFRIEIPSTTFYAPRGSIFYFWLILELSAVSPQANIGPDTFLTTQSIYLSRIQ